MRRIQPFATVLIFAIVGGVQLLGGLDVQGQQIPRDKYLQHLPLKYPKIVRQTKASVKMNLFGSPPGSEYRDMDLDGIDDCRHKVLLDLAVRFAPYLVLNSTLIPMDFGLFMELEEPFPLIVDTWNISKSRSKHMSREKIDWNAPSGRLLSLLKTFDPFAPGPAYCSGAVAPDGAEHQVMFFDFPGDGEEKWKQKYVDKESGALPKPYKDFAKVFVHPFLESEESPVTGHQDYAFILQYWFFYPYNDWINNHEGDWEHINVSIRPLDKLDEPLSEADVRQILAGTALDNLVIHQVDYYFHHKVMTLDYTCPNVYQPREKWETDIECIKEKRLKEEWIWEEVWDRAYWDDDRKIINTHPIGFIGGDYKSVSQLLELLGKSDTASNGTYPFPGSYKNVGPVGAIEKISDPYNHQEHFAEGRYKRTVPKEGYQPGSVVGFASPDRIKILPDGERIVELVKMDAKARRKWAWLVLPIRWGYPATESPFVSTMADAIAHTNLGNISVLGPSYNAGWNRSGNAPGFQVYSPHTFDSRVRFDLQDNFASDIGFLSLGESLLQMAPPLNIFFITTDARAEDRTFLDNESLPQRFLSATLGFTYMFMSQDFGDLILDEELVRGIGPRLTNAFGQDNHMIGEQRPSVEDAFMVYGAINFYLGEHLETQNLLRFGYPTFSYNITSPSTEKDFQIRGNIAFWEYSGSVRVNRRVGNCMIFAKGGYGWSLYQLENVFTNDELLPDPDSTWINNTFLPNTWHFGGGIEWTPFPNFMYSKFLPSGIDISVQGEVLCYKHSLGIDIEGGFRTSSGILIKNVSKISQGITRHALNLSLTVGF